MRTTSAMRRRPDPDPPARAQVQRDRDQPSAGISRSSASGASKRDAHQARAPGRRAEPRRRATARMPDEAVTVVERPLDAQARSSTSSTIGTHSSSRVVGRSVAEPSRRAPAEVGVRAERLDRRRGPRARSSIRRRRTGRRRSGPGRSDRPARSRRAPTPRRRPTPAGCVASGARRAPTTPADADGRGVASGSATGVTV